MALIGKREDLIHVPWSSVEEWLHVYRQIFLGDLTEQKEACEALLVWKARIPKLPVGVECTLGLLQVCLRDREWIPKINNIEMSVSYENDLRMMYSTVIMKFLNHISNIAHTKQTSLFIIAKELKIPAWIVDLRHDIAHGHELPSIDVMRIVSNILLIWLHEEYWAAEAKILEESQELENSDCLVSEDEETLFDLIELWTAVGLYVKTKHVTISDLPDTEVSKTLNSLFSKLNITYFDGSNTQPFSVTNETELSTILNLLLAEISKNLNKGDSPIRREKIVIDCVLNNEAFLINSEISSIFVEKESIEDKNCLPESLIKFWTDFLLLLQDRKILLSLFLQLIELIKIEKDQNRKLLASLWVKTIAQAFRKQKIARHLYQNLEQKFDHENKKYSMKFLFKTVQNELDIQYPDLKNVLTLNMNGEFPKCLLDEAFVQRLLLNLTEFSEIFIPEILNISSFLNSNCKTKSKLLDLMKIQSLAGTSNETNVEKVEEMEVDKTEEMEIEKIKEIEVEKTKETDIIYTIENLKEIEKSKEADTIYTIENLKEIEKTKETDIIYTIENLKEIEKSKEADTIYTIENLKEIEKTKETNTINTIENLKEVEKTKETDTIFTIENLKEVEKNQNTSNETVINENLADCKIRNTSWKIASADYDWSSCPIGILPWQINDIQPMGSNSVSSSDVQYAIVKKVELPKIIDTNNLKLHSKIQWDNLLKKNKKFKRKEKSSEIMTTVVNRAMENVKKMKKQDVN